MGSPSPSFVHKLDTLPHNHQARLGGPKAESSVGLQGQGAGVGAWEATKGVGPWSGPDCKHRVLGGALRQGAG